MFHNRCDQCGARGEEYSAFPHCRECMDDVCLSCCVDYDPETLRATCNQCIADTEREDDELPEPKAERDEDKRIDGRRG